MVTDCIRTANLKEVCTLQRRAALAGIMVLLVAAAATYAVFNGVGGARSAPAVGTGHHNGTVISTQPRPATPVSQTILQAWRLATQAAQQWSAHAAITELYSTDTGTALGPAVFGADGRRTKWRAILVSPDKLAWQLQVDIEDGAATATIEQPRVTTAPPMSAPPKLDSPAAI